MHVFKVITYEYYPLEISIHLQMNSRVHLVFNTSLKTKRLALTSLFNECQTCYNKIWMFSGNLRKRTCFFPRCTLGNYERS